MASDVECTVQCARCSAGCKVDAPGEAAAFRKSKTHGLTLNRALRSGPLAQTPFVSLTRALSLACLLSLSKRASLRIAALLQGSCFGFVFRSSRARCGCREQSEKGRVRSVVWCVVCDGKCDGGSCCRGVGCRVSEFGIRDAAPLGVMCGVSGVGIHHHLKFTTVRGYGSPLPVGVGWEGPIDTMNRRIRRARNVKTQGGAFIRKQFFFDQ